MFCLQDALYWPNVTSSAKITACTRRSTNRRASRADAITHFYEIISKDLLRKAIFHFDSFVIMIARSAVIGQLMRICDEMPRVCTLKSSTRKSLATKKNRMEREGTCADGDIAGPVPVGFADAPLGVVEEAAASGTTILGERQKSCRLVDEA